MSTAGNQVSTTESNQTESTLGSQPTVPPAVWESGTAGFPGELSAAAAFPAWRVGDVVRITVRGQ